MFNSTLILYQFIIRHLSLCLIGEFFAGNTFSRDIPCGPAAVQPYESQLALLSTT